MRARPLGAKVPRGTQMSHDLAARRKWGASIGGYSGNPDYPVILHVVERSGQPWTTGHKTEAAARAYAKTEYGLEVT